MQQRVHDYELMQVCDFLSGIKQEKWIPRKAKFLMIHTFYYILIWIWVRCFQVFDRAIKARVTNSEIFWFGIVFFF